jgi:hypothetical protein
MRALLLTLLAAAALLLLAGPTARGCPPEGYGYGGPQSYGGWNGGGGWGGWQQPQFFPQQFSQQQAFELDFQRRGLLGRPRESIRLRSFDSQFGQPWQQPWGGGGWQQPWQPSPYSVGGYGGGYFRGGG